MPPKDKQFTIDNVKKLAKKVTRKFERYAALQMLLGWFHEIADGWF